MRETLIVKELNRGYVINNGKIEDAAGYEDTAQDLGNRVLGFLMGSGGDTCTVTIEGLDKPKKEDKP